MGFCSELTVSQEKWTRKTNYGIERKENERRSWSNPQRKIKIVKITWKLIEGKLRAKKTHSWADGERKDINWKATKIRKNAISQEA